MRIRCKVDTLVTAWVRVGIHCDGNPDNLSQFISRPIAAQICRIAALRWELVELVKEGPRAGLPEDPQLQERYVGWLKERYGITVAADAGPAAEAAPLATNPAGGSGEPSPDAPPAGGDSESDTEEGEGSEETAKEPPPAADEKTAPIAGAAAPPQPKQQSRRERRAGGHAAGAG